MTPGYNGILDIFKDDFDLHPKDRKRIGKRVRRRGAIRIGGKHEHTLLSTL